MAKKVVEEVKAGVTSKILSCGCKSEYQDQRHGFGQRVMNELGGGRAGKRNEYRCTVCGTVVRL